ncbi:MAG: hypothetical protein ABI939_04935 [Anaerolineaceae bacterium]
MVRSLLALSVFSVIVFVACGGGDSATTPKSDGTGGGARAMAAAIETDLGKLKDCFQGEKDGKGPCGTDLLTTQTTVLCSDVKTGKANTFGVANYKVFEPVCASWSLLLGTPLAERPDAISAIVEKAKAIN